MYELQSFRYEKFIGVIPATNVTIVAGITKGELRVAIQNGEHIW
jgi:hypothetical protein